MENEEFYTQCVDCIFFRDGICKADKDRYLITENGREKLMWECNEVSRKTKNTMDSKPKYYSEPLTVEKLMAAGWECNVSREHPYKRQFRKEGERFSDFCCDVMFVVFEDGKVSVYYYDDTTDHKVDIRRNGQITVREFNTLLDIVKLEKFNI